MKELTTLLLRSEVKSDEMNNCLIVIIYI